MTSRSPRVTAGGGGAGRWTRDGRRVGGDPGRSFGPHAGFGLSDASEVRAPDECYRGGYGGYWRGAPMNARGGPDECPDGVP